MSKIDFNRAEQALKSEIKSITLEIHPMNTQATAPVAEAAPVKKTDEQIKQEAIAKSKAEFQKVLDNPEHTISDFVKLAKDKHMDSEFVRLFEDFGDSINKRITPPDADADFNQLTAQLAAAKTLEDRLKFTLQIQDVVKSSGTQYDEIRKHTADLSDEDFFFAHADRIQRLVDSQIIDVLKRSQRAVLKFKRAETAEGAAAKPKKAKETVSFTFKGIDYKDISTATQASLSGHLLTISKETGLPTKKAIFEVIKDPAKAKKMGFTNVKLQKIEQPAPTPTPTIPETAGA